MLTFQIYEGVSFITAIFRKGGSRMHLGDEGMNCSIYV